MSRKIILGEIYYSKLAPALEKLGYEPLCLPKNPFVDKRLASHTDLSLFSNGAGTFVAAPYLRKKDIIRRLESSGITVRFAEIAQSSEYPNDAALNALLFSDKLIYAEKITANEVIEASRGAAGDDLRLISVKQGYVRCSVCALGNNALITADGGIAKSLEREGLDVLLISRQGVLLDGFEYGFIGGASVLLEDDLLAFTGTTSAIADAKEIERFAAAHGVRTVFLTDGPAFDIGGAIVI